MTHRWVRAMKKISDNEIVFCGVCGKNCGKRKDHNFAHSHIRKNKYGNRVAICNECDSIERKVRLIKYQQEMKEREYIDSMKDKIKARKMFS
tara:strand:- start:365 stop:640 length:276 start_codon:yes stop_codon:yes gene_type:complete